MRWLGSGVKTRVLFTAGLKIGRVLNGKSSFFQATHPACQQSHRAACGLGGKAGLGPPPQVLDMRSIGVAGPRSVQLPAAAPGPHELRWLTSEAAERLFVRLDSHGR